MQCSAQSSRKVRQRSRWWMGTCVSVPYWPAAHRVSAYRPYSPEAHRVPSGLWIAGAVLSRAAERAAHQKHTSRSAPLMRPTMSCTCDRRFWYSQSRSAPLMRPTISCTCDRRFWYSGTSRRLGTAIWMSTTLCRKSGCSSRNFSKARSFCGMPLIMSRRSTPSMTLRPAYLQKRADFPGVPGWESWEWRRADADCADAWPVGATVPWQALITSARRTRGAGGRTGAGGTSNEGVRAETRDSGGGKPHRRWRNRPLQVCTAEGEVGIVKTIYFGYQLLPCFPPAPARPHTRPQCTDEAISGPVS